MTQNSQEQEKRYNRIQNYFKYGEDKEKFEKELLTNEELAMETENYRMADLFFCHLEEKKLKESLEKGLPEFNEKEKKALLKKLKQIDRELDYPQRKKKIKFLYFIGRIAASVLIIFLSIYLFSQYPGNTKKINLVASDPKQESEKKTAKSIPENSINTNMQIEKRKELKLETKNEPPEEFIAQNFEPNTELEKILKLNYKNHSEGARLNTPADDILVSDTLKMDVFLPGETLILKIFTNKNIEVYQSNSNYKVYVNSYVPGLYYWKLSNSEQLLRAGRFYVKEKR